MSYHSSKSTEVRETRSEIYNTKRPPPPLAAAHGEERERGERCGEEREKRERQRGERERDRRRLGLPVSGIFLQSFALEFLMRDKGGRGLYL
ncbi:hypothetical protein YC2023_067599 [Brassica napus]